MNFHIRVSYDLNFSFNFEAFHQLRIALHCFSQHVFVEVIKFLIQILKNNLRFQ